MMFGFNGVCIRWGRDRRALRLENLGLRKETRVQSRQTKIENAFLDFKFF
jgi:hypothetical protein